MTDTDCTVTRSGTEVELEPNTVAFYREFSMTSTYFDAARQHDETADSAIATTAFSPAFPMMAAQLLGV